MSTKSKRSTPSTLRRRSSGVLLHPTSLPGPHGSGDLGPAAHRFVAWLADARLAWWQMLPVGPVGYGNSPYSAQSTFAGNPLLVSLERLARDGLLLESELAPPACARPNRVDYGGVSAFRHAALARAFERFRTRPEARRAMGEFVERNASWLEDFALFRAIKSAHGERAWITWEPDLRDRKPRAMARARKALADDIARAQFAEYAFDAQWTELRTACSERGVRLIGDVPIFVAHDSADVWQHRELFHLDASGQPTVIAGVPPDYFSATGQRWGNPLYRWPRIKKTGYAWWIARLGAALARFDVVRLDHFIGFVRCWEIPASEPTAINGTWRPVPGRELFERAKKKLGGELPLIAEDLGLVTPAVRRLRRDLGLPGIRLLQFAFGTDPQAHLFVPHNYVRNAVAYTGTHDNDTTCGWFYEKGGEGSTRTPEQTQKERANALEYLGEAGDLEIHWALIRTVYASVARLAITPVQDFLGLGSESRMNKPGTLEGNWEWRLDEADLTAELAERVRKLAVTYGR